MISSSKATQNLKHIAFIMDGNARWAKENKVPTHKGHEAGAAQARKIAQYALEKKIPYISFFAFSYENWNRPETEINFLMKLLEHSFEKDLDFFSKNKVCVHFVGMEARLPKSLKSKIQRLNKLSIDKPKMHLGIAANYSGKQDIISSVQKVLEKGEQLTEKSISENLMSSSFPDPDLIVRTGGWSRISNFYLWQAAYSEIHISQKLWPDFNIKDMDKAIAQYQQTVRNFGKRLTGTSSHEASPL